MIYALPELLELTPTQVNSLKTLPCFIGSTETDSFLPDSMQFELAYDARPGTPQPPLPVVTVTLYPARGQYVTTIGLISAPAGYSPEHDDPIVSPLLSRSFVLAVLGSVKIFLNVVPDDENLLRPISTSESWVGQAPLERVNEQLEISPTSNVVTENRNPLEAVAPPANLMATGEAERVLVATQQPDSVRVLTAAPPKEATLEESLAPSSPDEDMRALSQRYIESVDPAKAEGLPVRGITMVLTGADGQQQASTYETVGTPTLEEVVEIARTRFQKKGILRVYNAQAFAQHRAGTPAPAPYYETEFSPSGQ